MPRKFMYTMHALVENYSTNQVTHLIYSGGVWTPIENITAGPSTNNLSSLAANTQGSRVLYANYSAGAIVPLDYLGGLGFQEHRYLKVELTALLLRCQAMVCMPCLQVTLLLQLPLMSSIQVLDFGWLILLLVFHHNTSILFK